MIEIFSLIELCYWVAWCNLYLPHSCGMLNTKLTL